MKKLNPLYSGESFEESELAKYVPDTMPEGLPNDGKGDSEDEQLDPKPRASQTEQHPVTTVVGSKTSAESGQAGAGGGRSNSDTSKSKQPGGAGSGQGGQGERPALPAVPCLHVRSMNLTGNRYRLVIRCAEAFTGRLAVCAIGEDGEKVHLGLERAVLEETTPIPLGISGDAIQGISLAAGVPCSLDVTVGADRKLSLAAVALP